MRILMAVASRHGSTQEIAEAIAQELRAAGHAVDVRSAGEASVVERYDAVIIGSAIYMGGWLPEARRFVERSRQALATRPVWLFSSGPLGTEQPQASGDPAQIAALLAATGARGHRLFVGKLDPSRLGSGERLIVRVVHAPAGDFRDWEAIQVWAREIATAVQLPAALGQG